MSVNPYDPSAVRHALRSSIADFHPRPAPARVSAPAAERVLRLHRICLWCQPPHVIDPGDPGAPITHGMCAEAEARELARMPVESGRMWRDAAQISSLANIFEALLATREGREPRLLAQLSAEEQHRRQAHAHRALRELDGAAVGVAAYRATQAATKVLQERLFPAVPLTDEQLTAVRGMVEAALRAYGAALEGPFAREDTP
jgi:hypothetical protein